MKKTILLVPLALLLAGCTPNQSQSNTPQLLLSNPQISVITPSVATDQNIIKPNNPMSQKTIAVIHTSQGDMTINLFPDKAPNTVANFVGLAKGTKDWIDPKTGGKVSGKALYQNVIFHRVIKDFMIQGGDPLGNGRGGPGYRFADEPVTESYTRGTLAMANAGPNTNGSQFFIVHKDYPLPKDYTIFGRISASDSASLSVLDKIATTPTDENDKPVTDIIIKNIDIIEE